MIKKPNLLHISISSEGGAGKAAFNVYKRLKNSGYTSEFLVLDSGNNEISELNKTSKYIRKAKRFLFKSGQSKLEDKYQMYGIDEETSFVSTDSLKKVIKNPPDFIFVYWISSFLNAKVLFELSDYYNAKVIFHITDMAFFTGGCHFALQCNGYEFACENCPGIKDISMKDRGLKNILFKEYYYRKFRYAVVGGTTNIIKQISQSRLFSQSEKHLIRYEVDPAIFGKNQKDVLREEYGIDKDKIVLFFGATHIKQERKGFSELKEALDHLSIKLEETQKDKILLLVAGNGYEEMMEQFPFPYKGLGFLKNDTELSNAYSLADIFLNTSIDDLGPFMLVEAMMSKNIIVSYSVGLAIDLIVDGQTGFLAKNFEPKNYADQIYQAIHLSEEKRMVITSSSKAKAIKNHSWNQQLSKYENIFYSS